MADKIITADNKSYNSADFEKLLTDILNKHYSRTGDTVYVKSSAITELEKLLPKPEDWLQLRGHDRMCATLVKNLQTAVDNNPDGREIGIAKAAIVCLTPKNLGEEQFRKAFQASKAQSVTYAKNPRAPVSDGGTWTNFVADTGAELPDH